jgi:hypothetical protein
MVEVEPAVEGATAFFGVVVDGAVGPAAEQGADEALGFAVGARPVRPCAEVLEAERSAGDLVDETAVTGAVVGT